MRTQIMKLTGIAALWVMFFAAPIALAEDYPRPELYIESNFGFSDAEAGDLLDIHPVNVSDFSDTGFAWNLNAVFEFYPNVAVVFGYTDVDNPRKDGSKVDLDVWHALLRAYLPFTPDRKWRLFANGGAAFVQGDGSTTYDGMKFRRDRNETNPQIGAGMMAELPDRQIGFFNTNQILFNTQFNYIFGQELGDIYTVTGGIGLKLFS